MKAEEIQQIEDQVDALLPLIEQVKEEMGQVIVGQRVLVDRLLMATLTRGHILLEGVPGLAKTTAIATLAQVLDLEFRRIQFTPDLLPADLTGSMIYNPKSMDFFTRKGPIFSNFILADEINRSPAKVQSALLEAMQEKQVTIGEETFKLPDPFLVMATQNPIEQEGTYPLPEAQVDRFLLKTVLDYPSRKEEIEVVRRSEKSNHDLPKKTVSRKKIGEMQKLVEQIYADEKIIKYVTDLVFYSREPNGTGALKRLIAYGASPRASIGLVKVAKAAAMLHGRGYVLPEDVKEVAMDVLQHRVIPTYEAQAEGVDSRQIIEEIMGKVQVP
jgi:MoxR-like ATPase